MKKILITVVGLVFIIIGGYFFIRFRYLKAKDFKPDTTKQKNAIDLRPSIIAKFQQLVKDGSDGLYVLSIDSIEPHLLSSKLDITGGFLRIDTPAMRHLDSLQLLPDDIFTASFTALHIDGIGISDLLNKDRIDIKNISLLNPVINRYHKNRKYNEASRTRNDTLTLYNKLKGRLKSIIIGNISVKNGTLLSHDIEKKTVEKYRDISVIMNDILVDSTTQYNRNRFLFAKQATISTKNYSIPTADSLYYFSAGNITISADRHMVTAQDLELRPRLNRQQFESRLRYNKDLYHLVFSKVILNNINWQAFLNNENIIASNAVIEGGKCSIYFDRSIPQGPIKLDNFPHQVLMRLPLPLSIKKCSIRNLDFSYEEHNPLTDKNGIVYFDNVSARIDNMSNIPSEARINRWAVFSGTALFMHHVPLTVKFRFDLLKYRTGEFTADVKMNTLDNITVNPIAEPLGLFKVKTGKMQQAIIHIAGNNFKTNGNIAMQYNDLHITPLKKDGEGGLKKKTFTGLLANIILIKNDNPKDDEFRQPDFTVERGSHKNFFNLLWTSILTGIAKSIGIPVKFAVKK